MGFNVLSRLIRAWDAGRDSQEAQQLGRLRSEGSS